MNKKIIIFGAGQIGRQAIAKYGYDVAFIIDNNSELWGRTIDGIQIKPVKCVLEIDDIQEYRLILASRQTESMIKQLKELGIEKYEYLNKDTRGYYMTDELIYNPYLNNAGWNDYYHNRVRMNLAIESINSTVSKMYEDIKLFDHVEIETINKCNGVCEFCPVNVRNDTREHIIMSDNVFHKIIDELGQLKYSGKLALFSNNEPFLDPDILKRLRYARENVPLARMHLYTNGTLLTIDRFEEAVRYLDELVIDNYNQELQLIPNCKKIVEYCEKHEALKYKVTIVLRKPKELLTNRGGDAPNRNDIVSLGDAMCPLPFKQMIIRPDGKVSLCCNDPLGRDTLGDASKESLLDIWYGEKYKIVRDCVYKGRSNWEHCSKCDVLSF